jgi:hypothetical protein
VKQDTDIKWHRTTFIFYWGWKSRSKGGRPKVSREVINLMANDNLSLGAPRIYGELKKLGYDVSESTVQRYIPKRGKRQQVKTGKHS